MKGLIFISMLVSASVCVTAGDPAVYAGEWNNKVNKGPITVTALLVENGEWQVRFDGKSNDDLFTYEVAFTSSIGANGVTNLQGNAHIAGEKYQLSCSMNESTFFVHFKSDRGSEGEFQLSRTANKTK